MWRTPASAITKTGVQLPAEFVASRWIIGAMAALACPPFGASGYGDGAESKIRHASALPCASLVRSMWRLLGTSRSGLRHADRAR